MPSNLTKYIPQFVPKIIPLQIVDDLYTLQAQYPFLFLGYSTLNDIKASSPPLVDSKNPNDVDTILKNWSLSKMINTGGLFGLSSELELETIKLPPGTYNLPALATIVPTDDPQSFDMGIQPITITDNSTNQVYNNLELPESFKSDMRHVGISMGLFKAPGGDVIYEQTYFSSATNHDVPLNWTGTDKVSVANTIANWLNTALMLYQMSGGIIVQGTENISISADADGVITVDIPNPGFTPWKDKSGADIEHPIEAYISLYHHKYTYPDAYALILENNIKS